MQEKGIKNKRNFFKLLFFVIGLLSFSKIIYASTLNLSPSIGTFSVGDNISVNLVVSTDSSVNAISSILKFSNNTLSLSSISKSGSVITLWPIGPTFSNQNGTASIEGVVLSGYIGSSGKVVTLNFKAIKEGQAFVGFSSGSVLANDGQGTNTLLASNGSNFEIIKRKTTLDANKEPAQIATNNTIKIEEVKDSTLEFGQTQFLITPPRPAKNSTYNIQIDSEKVFTFVDEGDSIFKTQVLEKGGHTIRINAFDQNNTLMSGVTEFIILPKSIEGVSKEQTSKITERNIENILISLAIIITILIFLLIFILIIINRNKKRLYTSLKKSRNTIIKTFSILEEDELDENSIIRKLKNHKILTEEEEVDITRFSKDLNDAKSTLIEEIDGLRNKHEK